MGSAVGNSQSKAASASGGASDRSQPSTPRPVSPEPCRKMTVGRTAAVVAMFAAITKLRRIGWRFGGTIAVLRGYEKAAATRWRSALVIF